MSRNCVFDSNHGQLVRYTLKEKAGWKTNRFRFWNNGHNFFCNRILSDHLSRFYLRHFFPPKLFLHLFGDFGIFDEHWGTFLFCFLLRHSFSKTWICFSFWILVSSPGSQDQKMFNFGQIMFGLFLCYTGSYWTHSKRSNAFQTLDLWIWLAQVIIELKLGFKISLSKLTFFAALWKLESDFLWTFSHFWYWLFMSTKKSTKSPKRNKKTFGF